MFVRNVELADAIEAFVLKEFQKGNGCPSQNEIADAVGVKRGSVSGQLEWLVTEGRLRRLPGQNRNLRPPLKKK